ncbi:MAG: biopolymer transporter ExbD [Kiritimatiellae bacterium]|nr:biopolymer transporter ExbD [Kiritimatiellia bacterium]
MNAAWFRYLVQMAPWLTVLLIAAFFLILQSVMAPVPSLLFDLPEAGAADSVKPGLVALLIPGDIEGAETDGTLVYFDDARYVLSDPVSLEELSNRLGERAVETKSGVLTLLSDRRVPAGDVMKVMALAKARRLLHVQLAEKRD